ncbi:L-seryl-tRNA(Sec) kinase [Drosophila kikkawai]|uniref:L-seryl-tRNA(Sec) kinase n=1 Tax=Drosophila kikkawai TaxID=30033 RepID=A0A6P4JJV9_DROKI|nr:L-seryl-tRNA(Sec) kinase [Drosophila kikkawai]KAH8342817.1 hypothetical protein KR059_000483 [Drosophila kikkawai]
MAHICLLALIGLPGAGKSTLCGWLLGQQAALRSRHLVHLCYDDFLNARPTSSELPYKEQRALIFSLLRQIVSAIREGAAWPGQVRRTTAGNSNGSDGDYLILCDDNFYYRSMRYKLHQLCRDAGCVFGQIHVDSSLDSCLQANARRRGNDRVPDAVIREMHERMEAPGSEAWESNSLTVASADPEVAGSMILNFINSLNAKLVSEQSLPATGQDQQQEQSLAHGLDLLLRGRIKTLLNGMPQPADKRTASARLNEERKRILTRFRIDAGAGRQADLKYYVHLLN